MIFGYRVAANPVRDGAYSLDYCCADDEVWVSLIMVLVLEVLDSLPETLTAEEARKLFPQQNIKPIKNDPECFEKLKQLAFNHGSN